MRSTKKIDFARTVPNENNLKGQVWMFSTTCPFVSFTMDVPRAEICCEIGRLFMEKREYVTAAYWYQQALLAPRKKKNGGFYIADSHDFIPAIQMCVCLDKAGRHREAFEFHKKARVLKPLHQAVIGNEKYFRDVWGME